MAQSSARSLWGWLAIALVAILSIGVTLFVMLPASLVAPRIASATGQHLMFDAVEGTLWSGDASVLVGSTDASSAPLVLPGRLHWTLSPWAVLTGRIDARLSDAALLADDVTLRGSLGHLEISAARIFLPDGTAAHLGPPLSTLGIDGVIGASSPGLVIAKYKAFGSGELTLDKARSSVSKIAPLGSYRVSFALQGENGTFRLRTDRGPLLLTGEGHWTPNGVSFTGNANAEPAYRDQLADLLGILGRAQGDGSYQLRFGN